MGSWTLISVKVLYDDAYVMRGARHKTLRCEMTRYRLNWKKLKTPESALALIVGFVTGAMLSHTGTSFLVDLLVISVVSGVSNWWLGRYMDKKFSESEASA